MLVYTLSELIGLAVLALFVLAWLACLALDWLADLTWRRWRRK